MIVGFENFWIEDEKITPIGAVQQSAQRWVKQHGQPGAMHTPVALMVDFHAGWTLPRHLYTTNVYRVWGNLPYGPGDFLTEAILDLLYPGYQDSSFYHDESGFIAPTPYGDIADCLLSDAEGWLLARYPVLVVAGELAGGMEIRDKLEAYAAQGGHLIITAGNLAKLPGGLAGRTVVAKDIRLRHGKGHITFFARAFGVQAARRGRPLTNEIDRPLAKLFELAPEVRRGLDRIFRRQELFTVNGEGLSIVTCRKGKGRYTVGVANNTWRETKFSIHSRCGPIEAIEELTIDPSALTAVGWQPEGVDPAGSGTSGDGRIAGGDIRIFAIRVKEKRVTEIVHSRPPRRPRGRLLSLRSAGTIKDAILDRPTFFAHYDGVVVDWRYWHEREPAALKAEAGWIQRQGLRVVADLSSGLNLYPTLRLVDNVAADYAASMATIESLLTKLELLGARDLLISLHRYPENNTTPEEAEAAMVRTCQSLAQKAAACGVTLHLRLAPDKPPQSLAAADRFLDKVAAAGLKLAPALGLLLAGTGEPKGGHGTWRRRLGFWLAAAPQYDASGRLYGAHGQLHKLSPQAMRRLGKWLDVAPEIPVIFDAILASHDEEYLDAAMLAEK